MCPHILHVQVIFVFVRGGGCDVYVCIIYKWIHEVVELFDSSKRCNFEKDTFLVLSTRSQIELTARGFRDDFPDSGRFA